MNTLDARPPIWVGHIVLETNCLDESEQFMRTLGMRPIVKRPGLAVLELRGGTHLVMANIADHTWRCSIRFNGETHTVDHACAVLGRAPNGDVDYGSKMLMVTTVSC